MPDPTPHIPVLLNEVLEGLKASDPALRWIIDGTVGAGGHASAILQAAPQAVLLGIDRDPRSLEIAAERLRPFGGKVFLAHGSHAGMVEIAVKAGFPAGQIDGILLDLGIASMHVDDPTRGFAFGQDGPLDMRFDPAGGLPSAAELIDQLDAGELADLIFQYGEERHARRIATAIVGARPLTTTRQLAAVIEGAAGGLYRKAGERLHPATRTFQALRIAVNHELEEIEKTLPAALSLLSPGGRLAVIAFHSLEDRLVKTFFHREARDCLCPPRQPVCTCGHVAVLREITRKPLGASEAELATNPRSRSARLRIAERL